MYRIIDDFFFFFFFFGCVSGLLERESLHVGGCRVSLCIVQGNKTELDGEAPFLYYSYNIYIDIDMDTHGIGR